MRGIFIFLCLILAGSAFNQIFIARYTDASIFIVGLVLMQGLSRIEQTIRERK